MARRTMRVDGIEELSEVLSHLANAAEFVAPMALYDGAGVVADAVTASINEIQTEPYHYAATDQRKPSPEEKELLLQGAAGIARFEKNGSEVQTSVGFDNAGYGMLMGRRVPIPMIANAINSGTSFMQKQPFFRKAVNRAKAAAQAAMLARGEAELEKITND